ncbi:MAG: hypothetical protein KGD64_08295 [Candidatus Heimdallarchaeota archaeon]|nr:hypothetical protein [Candidatus Heimdallarchaeota archaeon]
MVISAKDLVTKKPVISKPRTLNPLGAVIIALSMGGGQALIYKSFIDNTLNKGFSALGFFLLLLASASLLATLSIAGKYVSFMVKFEGEQKKTVQTALQIMYFYIGFIPIFGFTLVYSITSGTLEFWKILVVMGVFILFFAFEMFYVITIFYRREISLIELREPFFQPQLPLMIIISLLSVAISSVLLVFI